MIYTNLFKTNRASKSKNTLHYAVESRKYKISFIFDKKFLSIIYAMVLGTTLIVTVNVGIYGIAVYKNSGYLNDLSNQNANYTSSIDALNNKKTQYLAQKTNAENIYSISDRPTKWSNIVSDIADQLPYDGVLTSVETISAQEAATASSPANGTTANPTASTTPATNTATTPATPNSTATATNTATPNSTANNATANSTATPNSTATATNTATANSTANSTANNTTNNSATTNPNQTPATVKSGNKDAGLNRNNVVLIKGKCLSMVNISLFLDKLDGLQIFSKVECTKAEQSKATDDKDYYDFVIYATLN